jgi:hypothetical protein
VNTSPYTPEEQKSKRWKFWAKLSIAFIFLFAVLTFFSPSFHHKHFGFDQNEHAAVGSLRKVNTLESQYAAAHANKGFACELPLLQPTGKTQDAFDPNAALLSGEWSGYKFAVVGCAPVANGIVTHYRVTAVPVYPGGTGFRAFCTDESGKVFYDLNGSASECLAARLVLPD